MMRQRIQQSEELIAELVAKLQAEQTNLEKMKARVAKREDAIAFLLVEIEEDPDFWDEVRDRLNPPADEAEAIALPPTIIWNGNGVARLGCAKQKLAKEWAELLTLWGCATSVVKAESFSDKEIKWEVAILGITRSQLEILAKAHTSPQAEVPTSSAKKVGNSSSDDSVIECDRSQVLSEEPVQEERSFGDREADISKYDLALEILRYCYDIDAATASLCNFEYPEEIVEEALSWLSDKGYVEFNGNDWELKTEYYYGEPSPELAIAIRDFEEIHGEEFALLGKNEDEAICCVAYQILAYHFKNKKLKSGVDCFISRFPRNLIEEAYLWLQEKRCIKYPSSFEGARLIEPYCEEGKVSLALEELLNNFDRLSVTLDDVLDGASPLNLSDEQIDKLEQALVGEPTPSIEDFVDDKPSAYAEQMAQKIKPGSKLRSLSFPADPKHKSSRKRTGVVRRLEREGAYIYAFVSELTETGKDSRHTAFYNLEAVEIVEEAPAIDIAFDRFEPFDPTEDALGVVEAEILQFLKEKSAQADLYQDNQPDAPFSEILAATKLEGADRELALDALEKMEAKGLVSFDGDRWQIASEKPAQKEHNFKVGDRVTICGDSKGEDLVGKTGTLTAVSVTGCVLCLDGEDGKTRLFFCKEDLTPCSTFSQAA